jgi:hypothetical protein
MSKTKVRAKKTVNTTGEMAMTDSPMRQKDHEHISIRQIKNGHIVSRHGFKAGKSFDEEMYTPQKPKIDMKAAGAREKRLEGKKL